MRRRDWPVVLASLFIVAKGRAQDPQEKSLIGIWSSESLIGPYLRGPITIAHNGNKWKAVISSVETSFVPKGDSVRFSFAGNLGEFRGAFAHNRTTIDGWWIQPDGTKQDGPHDPGGLSQPFAGRVTLTLAQPNVWTGTIVPLDDTFTLYLEIWRATSGVLAAAFRNPELNLRGGSSQFRVTLVKDSVVFTARPDSTQPELRRVAHYDPEHKQLDIWWPQIQRQLILFPRTPAQAIGYFPKLPRGIKYSYVVPPASNDGLPSASASAVGFDEAQLERLIQRIIDTVQTSGRTPHIHSLLVARKGKLVLEEYFAGFDRDKPHDTRSAAKTFSSVMLGAAMQKGFPLTESTPITRVLASRGPFENPDPGKDRITLANLMTHGSGLDCDDNEDASPGGEDKMQTQTEKPDWWKYMLDLKMIHDPGTHFAYCSGSMNLVGAAIAVGTRTWLPEFFDRTIAEPLQFGRYYYNLMPTGEGYTGGGVHMRSRDLLKIGQLYLNGGVWNGKRIIPKAWVVQSTSRQTRAPGAPADTLSGTDGYAWHLGYMKSGERRYRIYQSNGNGGQLLIVLPELDMIVVFTAGDYGNFGVWGGYYGLVGSSIIPALVKKE
ncbi:MAG TPA: serine hydrolase domain-containing protein [Gemmatimonadaceae bacterium]|nr:serine hydrolase domain-containing protein [Gemmatimonadaceae bacterium]